MREKFTWLVIVPNEELPYRVFGFGNWGELNVLRASARNSAWKRSVTRKSLNSELSQFFIPGPLYGIVRANGTVWEGIAICYRYLAEYRRCNADK